MSFADEAELDAFLWRDHWLPHVNAESVAGALVGFPHEIVEGRSIEWLATAVRRSLGLTMPHPDDGPHKASNADKRDELEALGKQVGDAWVAMMTRSRSADDALWDHAWQSWIDEGHSLTGEWTGDPPDRERLNEALNLMDWLAGHLTRAARQVRPQRRGWRQNIERDLRTKRGCYLAVVFESAYRLPLTVNGFPTDARHPKPTAFMDFYQRMVGLAFGERATPDLPGILRQALRIHRQTPTSFGQGVIPDLQ
jgi:hypothetical protein